MDSFANFGDILKLRAFIRENAIMVLKIEFVNTNDNINLLF